jgi:hypothetical protein
MKRAIEEALVEYIEDMKPRFQRAAVSSLAVGNFPAYAENVGAYMILIDIKDILRGEKIKTTKEHIKDETERIEEEMTRAIKEKEQEQLEDVAVL